MKQAFEHVAASLTNAFKVNLAESEATTALDLIETMRQFFNSFQQIDIGYGDDKKIVYHDVSLVADDAIATLAELSILSADLELQSETHSLDQLSLEVAQWAMRHGGVIHTLAPIVNCFAHRANQIQDSNALVGLLYEMRTIIEHAADPIKADTGKLDPFRPWKILNLNYAIVATRTQLPELMTAAYNDLELNLPDECHTFFEEGLKQSEKMLYGDTVKIFMKRYFDKWTTKH